VLSEYVSIARTYRLLIIALGGLFGWLLSLPLFGPVLLTGFGEEAPRLSMWFLSSNFGAFLFFAWVLRRYVLSRRWGAGLSVVLFLGTLAIVPVDRYFPEALPVLPALFGIFAAGVIACWWRWFITVAQPGERGRILALSMILSNLILFVVSLAGSLNLVVAALGAVSALLLPLAAFVLAGDGGTSDPQMVQAGSGKSVIESRRILVIVCLFMVVTYAVGGMMYNYIRPHLQAPEFALGLELLPYMLILPIAGMVADRRGRRPLAFFAITGLGLGHLCFVFLSGTGQWAGTTLFLQGGFGFLDVFAWVVLADLSALLGLWAAFAGFGVMVGAILLGVLLTPGALIWFDEVHLVTFLSLAFLFVAVTLLWGLRETLRPPASAQGDGPSPIKLIVGVAETPLTPRELEIVELLYAHQSTKTIIAELQISPNTLKTHLKNIYRKTNCRSRKELLHKMVSGGR